MNASAVIYDAMTMPVVDPGMIGVGVFMLVASALIAARSWRRPMTGLAVIDAKVTQSRRAATAMAIVALGVLAYDGVETLIWRNDYSDHQYAVLDGCVTGFTETVQRNHDLGVDDFTLGGQSFRLSDSGWRVGYHRSRHHGSPIDEGAHLRAFAHGGALLRIEREDGPCMGRQARVLGSQL